MIYFNSDYLEGAHPALMAKLSRRIFGNAAKSDVVYSRHIESSGNISHSSAFVSAVSARHNESLFAERGEHGIILLNRALSGYYLHVFIFRKVHVSLRFVF